MILSVRFSDAAFSVPVKADIRPNAPIRLYWLFITNIRPKWIMPLLSKNYIFWIWHPAPHIRLFNTRACMPTECQKLITRQWNPGPKKETENAPSLQDAYIPMATNAKMCMVINAKQKTEERQQVEENNFWTYFLIFIYLAVPGLNHGKRDPLLWRVVSSSLSRDQTLAPCTRMES